ncbi:glycosyltransferase family 2 protein [Tychonema sp. LEGE 07203]|uniref:glycosyltransferase family 2 protein n=1 Tax=Tychonema sp. LEGE 07203 TaxID=1828671 RepID=UPI00188014C3|nr:glycosyltransferase family 2 protein [Tychonema sp. LEGE 07203]MBE9092790.1 glycosyltransferase family 2 protein [Tychonema sp. LEGE 07203]
MLQVIIPLKNRPEIGDCVRSLLVGFPVTKIIICDGGTTESQCLIALHALAQLKEIEWLKYPQSDFNKAQLINQGILRATAEYLLISDADIIWNQPAILQLLYSVLSPSSRKLLLSIENGAESVKNLPQLLPTPANSRENGIICCVKTVKESSPQTAALKRERYTYNIQIREQIAAVNIVEAVAGDRDRPGCGLICTRKQTLLCLGGYKQNFAGWGWEDQDLLIRATLLGIEICSAGKVIHLSHSDGTRNQHHQQLPPQQTRDRNIISCLQSITKGALFGDLAQPSILPPQFLKITTNFIQNYSCE